MSPARLTSASRRLALLLPAPPGDDIVRLELGRRDVRVRVKVALVARETAARRAQLDQLALRVERQVEKTTTRMCNSSSSLRVEEARAVREAAARVLGAQRLGELAARLRRDPVELDRRPGDRRAAREPCLAVRDRDLDRRAFERRLEREVRQVRPRAVDAAALESVCVACAQNRMRIGDRWWRVARPTTGTSRQNN